MVVSNSRFQLVQYTKGQALEPREKHAIVVVKKYFDRMRKDYMLPEASDQMTADALEFGLSTVRRVLADFNKDPSLLIKAPSPKGRPNHIIDSFYEFAVRSFIRSANQNGEYITLSKISEFLRTKRRENQTPLHHLIKNFKQMGF